MPGRDNLDFNAACSCDLRPRVRDVQSADAFSDFGFDCDGAPLFVLSAVACVSLRKTRGKSVTCVTCWTSQCKCVACVSTGHLVAIASEYSSCQYRTLHSECVGA
eukprot:3941947-Rhodomonas_salina.1